MAMPNVWNFPELWNMLFWHEHTHIHSYVFITKIQQKNCWGGQITAQGFQWACQVCVWTTNAQPKATECRQEQMHIFM